MTFHQGMLCGTIFVALLAAVLERRRGTVPDPLTLGVLVGAPLVYGVRTYAARVNVVDSLWVVGQSVLGAVLCAIVPLLLLRSKGLDLPDVKMFAAVGAMSLSIAGMHAQTYALLVSFAFAISELVRRQGLRGAWKAALGMCRMGKRKTPPSGIRIPLAPSIFAGTCIAVLVEWRYG